MNDGRTGGGEVIHRYLETEESRRYWLCVDRAAYSQSRIYPVMEAVLAPFDVLRALTEVSA